MSDPTNKTMEAVATKTVEAVATLTEMEPDNSRAHALAANVVATTQQLATLPPDHPAHSNWTTVLKLLLMIGPAIASPFIKNAGSRQIFEQESGIAGTVAESLPG